MNTFNYLNEYYNTHDEDARLSPKRGQVEFLTTVRYIGKYLKAGMKILEIGAGTGRYSHYFARQGYEVDAVELVPHNIEIFRGNTLPDEKITVAEGNATDLSAYADHAYDITLLLGPMYHLFTEEEKKRALSEAVRVTKPGGILFVAYCMNDATVIQYGFMRGNLLNGTEIKKGLSIGKPFVFPLPPEEVFVLYRKEDIDAFDEALPVRRLHLVGADLFTRYIAGTVEAMDDETYTLYLNDHFAVCEHAELVGISNHTLDVLQKHGENGAVPTEE